MIEYPDSDLLVIARLRAGCKRMTGQVRAWLLGACRSQAGLRGAEGFVWGYSSADELEKAS